MRHVTINDLAKELSLSPSTVSRALRNHPDISDSTKKKVLAAAEAANYHPNLVAQSLQNRRSNIIGVVVPEIESTFFSTVISGIDAVTYDAGYTIMVCQSADTYDRELSNIRALVANRVAGLLVSISQETEDFTHLQKVLDQSIPLVMFDRIVEGFMTSKVIVDDYDGAYRAVSHMIQNGRKRIAHIGGPETLYIGRKRREGYEAALRDHGLEVDPELIFAYGTHEIDGERCAKELLKIKPMVDGIFCVNDPVAIGAFCYLQDAGLKIPDRIGIVGFSNNPNSTLVRPKLTTVNQPAFEMGKRSAMMLLEQLADSNESDAVREPETIVLRTELIVRDSS